MPHKNSHTERFGGPGASHENAKTGVISKRRHPRDPVKPHHSRVSGGGGEMDIHHTHDPATKR